MTIIVINLTLYYKNLIWNKKNKIILVFKFIILLLLIIYAKYVIYLLYLYNYVIL